MHPPCIVRIGGEYSTHERCATHLGSADFDQRHVAVEEVECQQKGLICQLELVIGKLQRSHAITPLVHSCMLNSQARNPDIRYSCSGVTHHVYQYVCAAAQRMYDGLPRDSITESVRRPTLRFHSNNTWRLVAVGLAAAGKIPACTWFM